MLIRVHQSIVSVVLVFLFFSLAFVKPHPESDPEAGPVIITEGAYKRSPPPGMISDSSMIVYRSSARPEDPLMSSGTSGWPQYKEITRNEDGVIISKPESGHKNENSIKQESNKSSRQEPESFTVKEEDAFDNLLNGGYGFLTGQGGFKVTKSLRDENTNRSETRKVFEQKYLEAIGKPRAHPIASTRTPENDRDQNETGTTTEDKPVAAPLIGGLSSSVLPNFGISAQVTENGDEFPKDVIYTFPEKIIYEPKSKSGSDHGQTQGWLENQANRPSNDLPPYGPPYDDHGLIVQEDNKKLPKRNVYAGQYSPSLDEPIFVNTHHTLIPQGHEDINKSNKEEIPFRPSQPDITSYLSYKSSQDFSGPALQTNVKPKMESAVNFEETVRSKGYVTTPAPSDLEKDQGTKKPSKDKSHYHPLKNKHNHTLYESIKSSKNLSSHKHDARQVKDKYQSNRYKKESPDIVSGTEKKPSYHTPPIVGKFQEILDEKFGQQGKSGAVGFQKFSMNGMDVEFDIVSGGSDEEDDDRTKIKKQYWQTRRQKVKKPKNGRKRQIQKLDIRGDRYRQRMKKGSRKNKNLNAKYDSKNFQKDIKNSSRDHLQKEEEKIDQDQLEKELIRSAEHKQTVEQNGKKRSERDFGSRHHPQHIKHFSPIVHDIPRKPDPFLDPTTPIPHLLALQDEDSIHVNIHIDPRDKYNTDLPPHFGNIDLVDVLHGPGFFTTTTAPPTTTVASTTPVLHNPTKTTISTLDKHNYRIYTTPKPTPLPEIIHHSEPPKVRKQKPKRPPPTISTLPPRTTKTTTHPPPYFHNNDVLHKTHPITKAPNSYLHTTNHPEEVSTLPPRLLNHFIATTTLPPRQYDIPPVGTTTLTPKQPHHITIKPSVNFSKKKKKKMKKQKSATIITPYKYKVISSLPKRPKPQPRLHHEHKFSAHFVPHEKDKKKHQKESSPIKTLPARKKYVHHYDHKQNNKSKKPVFVPHRPSPTTPIPLRHPPPHGKELKITKPKIEAIRAKEEDKKAKSVKHGRDRSGPTPRPLSLAPKPLTHELKPRLPAIPDISTFFPAPFLPEDQSNDGGNKNGMSDSNGDGQPVVRRVVLPTRVKSGNLFRPGEEIVPTITTTTTTAPSTTQSVSERQPFSFPNSMEPMIPLVEQTPPAFIREGPFYEEPYDFDKDNFPDYIYDTLGFSNPIYRDYESKESDFIDTDYSITGGFQFPTNLGEDNSSLQQNGLDEAEPAQTIMTAPDTSPMIQPRNENADVLSERRAVDDMDMAASSDDISLTKQILPAMNVETLRRRFENLELMKLPQSKKALPA